MATDLESAIKLGWLTITPQPTERVILCPLCLGVFSAEALSLGELLPEHVPPGALGGRVRTLTCKTCNHIHGAKFEGPLAERLRYEEFGKLEVGAEAESMFSFEASDNINTRVQYLGDQRFRISFDPGKSHPDHERIMRNLIDRKRIGTLRILPKRKFAKRNSALGLVRIAYLELFIATGYRLLLNRNLAQVREQLSQDHLDLLPDFGIADYDASTELPNIGIITEPESLRSYYICVELKSALGTAFRYGVLLPLPFAPGLGIYEQSAYFNQHGKWPIITVKPLESPL